MSAARHRDHRIELWVSSAEYERLQDLARQLGGTSTGSAISAVIRQGVNKLGPVFERPAQSRTLARKYSRVKVLEMRFAAEREARRRRRGSSS